MKAPSLSRASARGRGRAFLVVTLVAAGTALLVAAAAAQASAPTVEALGAALIEAQKAHLWRVAGWGAASLVAGLWMMAVTSPGAQPSWRGFGIQAAAWGAINLGIVAWAFGSGIAPAATTLTGALAAEDAYGNILLLNLGLNVGYMAVGATLAIAAGHGLARAHAVRGHGLGLIVQGLGLLILDGIAYTASSGRMAALQGLVEGLDLGLGPGGLDVTLLPVGW